MAVEFDFSQIPPLLSLALTGATLGGIFKVVRWTANSDSRVAQVEKDLAAHIENEKEVRADAAENHKELARKLEQTDQRVVAIDHDLRWIRTGAARRGNLDDSGAIEPILQRREK